MSDLKVGQVWTNTQGECVKIVRLNDDNQTLLAFRWGVVMEGTRSGLLNEFPILESEQ